MSRSTRHQNESSNVASERDHDDDDSFHKSMAESTWMVVNEELGVECDNDLDRSTEMSPQPHVSI